MAVETYLIEENSPLISEPEELDKWKELINKCGLEGQKTLVGKENKSPIPFPVMTAQMQAVYSTLCPHQTKASEYSTTAIPVRVLSMIALAVSECYFDEIYIWADDKNPDPIVVGMKKDAVQSWRETRYILARWGDELRSFPELLKIAIERKSNELRAHGNSKLNELKYKLENLSSLVNDYFYNGNNIYL
jgi:hypothetical protein